MNFRERYLDLLEKTLTFSLWPEPLRPVEYSADRGWRWRLANIADHILKTTVGARIGISRQIDRNVGRDWPALAHTMVGRRRLYNLRVLCERIEQNSIPGSFVECGAWRGGCSIFARACLNESRQVICCDSFDGLPFDPSEPHWCGYDCLKVSQGEVRQNFINYDLNHNVTLIRGLFSDTLTKVKGPIAILRCDGDMYSSTMQILGPLYPRLSVGGYVIIDDWAIDSCRRAVKDYLRINKLEPRILPIDSQSVYWRKEAH